MRMKRWICLGTALLLINGLVYFYYQNNIKIVGGAYVYPLDDTYIHLAIAKNAALYNNWGVVHDEFCSSSSAPLYTFILSVLIKLFGDSSQYPLFVNIVFGNLIILVLRFFFKRDIPFLGAVLFLCTPILLHIQILSGMEHTMHILLIITAFISFSKLISSEFKNKKYIFTFLIVTALLCLARYESMFFIFAMLVIMLLHKQYTLAVFTFIIGYAPLVFFGIWAMHQGGFFFPNSLLVKGDVNWSNGFIWMIGHYAKKLYSNIFSVIYFCIPIAAMTAVIIQEFIDQHRYCFNAFIAAVKKHGLVFSVFITILLHGLFASFGWLYRYEAYLLSLLYIVFIGTITRNIGSIKIYFKAGLTLVVSFVLMLDIAARIYPAHKTILLGGKNIHDQQIQMSKFLRTYYNEAMVMANDIGAITYYTNIKLLDLVGLGSTIIIQNKHDNGGGVLDKLLFTKQYPFNQYTLILIYDKWFGITRKEDYETLGWIKAGELRIVNNVVCGDAAVSFYTSDSEMAAGLKENLAQFRKTVPKDIVITVF